MLQAGRLLNGLALLLVLTFTYVLLTRTTGDRGFAFAGALLLAATPQVAGWAGLILTELPFLACQLGTLLAAEALLSAQPARPGGRRRAPARDDAEAVVAAFRERWAWATLAVASALLVLLRFLGAFFVFTFAALYLLRAARRGEARRAVAPVALYGLAAASPLALWLGAVALDGGPLLPRRPPSQLGVGEAVTGMADYLGDWLAPVAVAGVLLVVAAVLARRLSVGERGDKASAGAAGGRPRPRDRPPSGRGRRRARGETEPKASGLQDRASGEAGGSKRAAEAGTRAEAALRAATVQEPPTPAYGAAAQLLAAALAGYLLLLLVLRTTSAYYPIDEIGYRYMVPAWPLAFLLVLLAVHRFAGARRPRWLPAVGAVLALAVLAWQGRPLLDTSYPEPYPYPTATFQRALELLPEEAVILTNFGQAFASRLPEARVISIPSHQDFLYEMDLPELVERHQVEWLVLFALPPQLAGEMYGSWYRRWLEAPPREVPLAGAWRTSDGVIYQLVPGGEGAAGSVDSGNAGHAATAGGGRS